MFNDSWRFKKLAKGIELKEVTNDTSGWEEVTLPHTWNAVDGCDGYAESVVETDGSIGIMDHNGNSYFRGLGGYVKEYTFSSDEFGGRKIYIEFEGANTVTTLYVNGAKVGEPHRGGYAAFRYDITDYVRLDENNVFAVIVDNSRTTDIAPLDKEGDFTKFGGIYRNVSLIAADYVHIDLMDYGSEGIYVTTSDLTRQSAQTSVKVNITNDSRQTQRVTIKAEICDENKKSVEIAQQTAEVQEGETLSVALAFSVQNPHLWNGLKDPYLYSVKINLSAGIYQDERTVTFGYRYFSVSDGGLFLNDEKYNVYGVNYHQDSYENGFAMTNEQLDRDYSIMADMGVTSVRMAHYQHNRYEYDICDRRGYVVWTEVPLINHAVVNQETVPTKDFCDNIKQQLQELIKQNFNHPSILFWGISNELYDVSAEMKTLFTQLCNLAKAEDHGRTIIYADNVGSNETRSRSEAADALGYNRYDGWYYSVLGEMHTWVNEKMAADNRPACISEYGAGAAITQHMEHPAMEDIIPNGRPHYEEYQAIFHEETWADICSMKKLWGSFIWCMFDFASDTREEGDTRGLNDKGLVTRDRAVFKDSYYFYRSLWNSGNMVYITGRRFKSRKKNVPEVKLYSNAASVELFVNGRSYGMVEKAGLEENHKSIFRWQNILLMEGADNEVKAAAVYSDGTSGEDIVIISVAKG